MTACILWLIGMGVTEGLTGKEYWFWPKPLGKWIKEQVEKARNP